jgi:hypothetical protein
VPDNATDVTKALDFLLDNLRSHMCDYHHKTDAEQLARCEKMVRKALAELAARENRDRAGLLGRWRASRSK